MRELEGTRGFCEVDYEEFAYKYIKQNRRGYNRTNITFEDNVFKISAPKFESGEHTTIYMKPYGLKLNEIVETMLDIQGEMLYAQEIILQEEFIYKVKDKLTVDMIFKEVER